MTDYVANVRNYIQEHQVPMMTHYGELRMGGRRSAPSGNLVLPFLSETAERACAKQADNCLEPLYSMLETAGCTGSYPKNYLHYFVEKADAESSA